ncbi:CDP-glycerol glycerophosphotransferase family protein [Eggerthia catenaformis]|uniref:CDP-glycerol glycerophosphotransferase family protein n=1 Tax=Eggerthia catenaformis TaxID=31973 RepID=UPI0028E1AA92|nr:CDP-glycerol glycerophosphotransferase family protein [Eggerthia catenaformis]
MKQVKQLISKTIKLIYKLLYKLIPIDSHMILFISFHGRGYSDNPMALHQYLINHPEYKDYKLIYAIKKHKKKNLSIPGNTKVIEYFSISYFFYLARAKYWFVNCKLPKYVLKKDNQVYLQTWHGTPLKKLAHDIDVPDDTTFYRSGMNFEEMANTYDNDVSKYNYMISPSHFTTEVFQTAFQINKERLIETGYPRNDILSNYTREDIVRIKQQMHLPSNKKIILYAPTWRDNSFNMQGYTFNLEVNFKKWYEILKEDYIVIFKPHYLIVNDFDLTGLEDFVYYVDPIVDISSLYLISDLLITDYSSVFFDYAILKRPIYFYMYDLEDYRDALRGFYLDIYHDLPGDIIEDEDILLDKIKNSIYDYSKQSLFNQRFNNNEDGHASSRVIDIVLGD